MSMQFQGEEIDLFPEVHGNTTGLFRVIKCDYENFDNILVYETKGKLSNIRKSDIPIPDGDVYYQFFSEDYNLEIRRDDLDDGVS